MTQLKRWKTTGLVLRLGLAIVFMMIMELCAVSLSAQEPSQAVEVIAVPESDQAVESQIPPVLEVVPQPTQSRGSGAGRFGQPGPRSGASSSEPVYLSRETPLFERARQALQFDDFSSGMPIEGAGRFGQPGPREYGDMEEAPGFLDVLFPEKTREIREKYRKKTEDGEDESDDQLEDELPPTFLTRLNTLFFSQVLADATLPFSIRNPGPDSANFPNSAYTIERGHIYLETQPVQVSGPSNVQAYNYNAGYLLRFGLTDRVEFRLFSNGPTYFSHYDGNKRTGVGPTNYATGWSPVYIDFKVNFWEQRIRSFMPAMGMEVYMSTATGSSQFQSGVEGAINLLFDYNFGNDWNFEWNIGLQNANTSAPRLGNVYLPMFNAQWSLQKAMTENLAFYVHGYFNDAALPSYGGNTVVGAGALYYIGKKWSTWGNYNVGVEKYAGPAFTYNWGFAYAF